MDNVLYGAREGTMEYPGSAAGPDAVPTYVVKNKDTLDGIARRYGVSPESIAERNNLQAPYSLRPGQSLQVPGAKYVPPSEPVETASVAGRAERPASGPPGPVKKRDAGPAAGREGGRPRGEPGKPDGVRRPRTRRHGRADAARPPCREGAAARPDAALPVAVARQDPHALWRRQGGQKSDGIDIAADNGAPVKAADGGTVVYAGDGVPHLGNLLLIEHSAGYITAYGNNESLLVKKGDTVKKGQTIARAGSSGGAAEPARCTSRSAAAAPRPSTR